MNKKGMVYLIPTPIGNMDDLSKRIIDTLGIVDVIFCEDTRSTKILLNYLGINKKLISSHKFNEATNKNKILEFLKNEMIVGIVSDRGTPGISDPGYILSKYAIDAGYEVVALPGPTALIPALIVSGMVPQPFMFYGFLNSKSSERKKELNQLKYEKATLIFYEAPHRLKDTLSNMLEVLGDRDVCLEREISKIHEEVIRNKLSEIVKIADQLKGEFVIVVDGNHDEISFDDLSIIEHVDLYIKDGMSANDAIKTVAKERGVSKSIIYKEYHIGK